MSEIRYEDWDSPYLEKTFCDICGERATAYWAGRNCHVAVCAKCARETLPRIIADANWNDIERRNTWLAAHDVLLDASKSFWEGIAFRAINRKNVQ